MTAVEFQAQRMELIEELLRMDKEKLLKLKKIMQSLNMETCEKNIPLELLSLLMDKAKNEDEAGECLTNDQVEQEMRKW